MPDIAEIIREAVDEAFQDFFGPPPSETEYPYPKPEKEKEETPVMAFPEGFPGEKEFKEWLEKGLPTEEEKYPAPEFTEMNRPNEEGLRNFEKVVGSQGVELKNREIFAEGTWKGMEFDDQRLKRMVDNFHALKDRVKVPLKLSHDNKCCSGDPAIGWVSDMRKENGSIYADFKHVPRKVAEVIEKKAFSRPSIELQDRYDGYEDVIVGVAFLGADLPEVDTVDDLLDLYSQEPESVSVLEGPKPEREAPREFKVEEEALEEIASLDLSEKAKTLLKSCHPQVEFSLDSSKKQSLLFEIVTTQSAESRSLADELLRKIPTRRGDHGGR